MLVFMSDIHLTDGTSGETIESGAFRKFVLYLEKMAEVAGGVEEIEIVLLGDIFDVIRSDFWLRSDIRPWSGPGERDVEGRGLEEYAAEIAGRICRNENNSESMRYLKRLRDGMRDKGIRVRFTYIVGNHDRLANRYPRTRVSFAEFLGLEDSRLHEDMRFRTEAFWEDYRVFARHGDIYDPFNFDGGGEFSSLGDAIVIDLLSGFPLAVEREIGSAADPGLIKRLREIDNVRPIIDVPIWIQGACRRAKSEMIGEKVKGVWNGLVDDFLSIDFVKRHDRPWRIDLVDALQLGLRISKHLSFEDIANLPLRRFVKTEEDYRDKAFSEDYMRRNEAEFVVFGHTHNYGIQPLDRVPLPGGSMQKTYFNSGTWRKVQVRTACGRERHEFFGWHVMTFIAFYTGVERGGRRFEVWNGALG